MCFPSEVLNVVSVDLQALKPHALIAHPEWPGSMLHNSAYICVSAEGQ